MDDWGFARPLPPGAFPDEDHIAGRRDVKRKRKPIDQAQQPEPVRAS